MHHINAIPQKQTEPVQRLMRAMGLRAIYRRPSTSRRSPEHPVYPYLLRNVRITRPNQVWAADITYLPMARGFLYLVAVMDWHSRYVLAWRLSNTLEAGFCAEALEEALGQGQPEVFNADQGSQFTSWEFTQVLQDHGVRISMDGKGRYSDNIWQERWDSHLATCPISRVHLTPFNNWEPVIHLRRWPEGASIIAMRRGRNRPWLNRKTQSRLL